MNDAIFKFKRFEDSSLSYTGIDKHEGEDIGGWDTVIRKEEYERLFYNQQSTMTSPAPEIEEFTEEPETEKPVDKDEPIKTSAPAKKPLTEQFGFKPTIFKTPREEPKPEKPEFEMPKIYEGMRVTHGKFGEGTIKKVFINEKKVTVSFAVGEKTFITDEKSDMNAFKKGFLRVL